MKRREAQLAPVAGVVQRLAVLLAAGVAPASAWQYLDAAETPVVGRIAGRAARGEPVASAVLDALDGVPTDEAGAWRGLAAAWRVATDAGAPLAPSLRRFAGSLRALADAQREVATALAGPLATARMVMALPVVGVLFGLALGFDTIGTLVTTVPGIVCLVVGGALMLAARAWNRRLVARARPDDLTPGLRLELVAIAVSGGGSIDGALASVEAALAECGLANLSGDVDGILDLSRRAGVPAGELLRSEAEDARRTARADAATKAELLAVRLMLPLGLCILPAFMLVGVAPLLIAVISSTVTEF
jgi:tight adherence protein B